MNDNKFINVEIITPQNKIYSGKAITVSVPGSQSPFQILYNHAPIVSSLDTGVITLLDDSSVTRYYAISSGFLELNNNSLSILVESAIDSSQIDKSSVQKYLQQLNEELEKSGKAESELIKKKLSFAQAQLKASEKQ
jgi:F-type H+-transporting ATPase subunit epsilon